MVPAAVVPASAVQPEVVSTFVVERYWPGVNAQILATALARAATAAERLAQSGSVVRHLQSTLVPTEEIVFCLFEATSAAAVELVNRNADVTFDHVALAVVLAGVTQISPAPTNQKGVT